MRHVLCLALFGLSPGDWPQWGGPGRGFACESGAQPIAPWSGGGPRLLWERELGPGNSGIAVQGGLAVTAFRDGDDEVLLACDAATGALRWRHVEAAPLPAAFDAEFGRGPHGTPSLTECSVVFVGATGHLRVLRSDTGAVRWRARLVDDLGGTALERGYAASPLVLGQSVIVPVGGPGRALMALRLEDGAVEWRAGDDAATYASPALLEVGGAQHIVALGERALVGRDPRTGAELWRYAVEAENYALATTPLACSDGCVVFVDRRGATLLRVRSGSDGRCDVERVWTSRRLGSQVHNLALGLDSVIGANESATLCGLALSDGAPTFRERGLAESNVLRCGSALLTLSARGELTLSQLGAGDITIRARHAALEGRCWAAPALAGSVVFLRDDRKLVAYDLAPPAETR